MEVGGREYSKEVVQAVRAITVAVATLFVFYGLLVVSGFFKTPPSDTAIIGLAVSVAWLVFSVSYLAKKTQRVSDAAIWLVGTHFFLLTGVIFLIGLAQPFAALLVLLLFLISYLFFGKTGFVISIVVFALASIADILLHSVLDSPSVIANGFTALGIIAIAGAIIIVINAQETKRQALLHSQRRERLQFDRIVTIMNNLTDAAFSVDDKGKILMYNAACLDLLDTNDSLKGRAVSELFTLSNKEGDAVSLAALLKDTTRAVRRDDLNHTYADGESIRLEITFAPIRSNYDVTKKKEELGGYILIMRDVTKQKSLEEERDEFISVVSHELRTPITIVEGTLSNLDVLMNRPETPDPKMLSSTVTTAHDQVLYLAKMVNDLSTLSRAERGVADAAESIDVADLLHSMHVQYEKEAQQRGLHLNVDLGAQLGSVHASRLYLEELLQNFVTNAIKYTKEGSVTIIARRAKDTVMFTVKDTGIGISRTDQQKVFHKFYRSEDYRIRETNGTGLGLYVSAKLAQKLHTQIELKSRLNHGSAFSFILPVE